MRQSSALHLVLLKLLKLLLSQILIALPLDLSHGDLEILSESATGSSGCGRVGHLDWDNATEGTSARRVLASDQADVVLASHVAGALLIGGDGGVEREVGCCALLF
jgi:hypothetical protein